MIKILKETLIRNFHYVFRNQKEFKSVVERYPDKSSSRDSSDLFDNTKGYLSNDIDRCTGCGQCVELCPVKALSLEVSGDMAAGQKVEVFRIDLGKCFSCGVCVDSCPEASISFTRQFELAAKQESDLVKEISAERGMKSIPQRIRTYEVRR